MLRFHALALLLTFVPALAVAQDAPPLDEVAKLRKRVDELEKELARIRRVLGVPKPTASRVADPFVLVPTRPAAPAPGNDPDAPELDAEQGVSALTWLSKNQEDDGSWRSPNGGCDVSVTSLATLAFLGSGHTHRFGSYKPTVNKGLKWLKRRIKQGGAVASPNQRLPTLDQSLAAAALCEAYAVSRDFTLRRYAERTARALLLRQGEGGGWSYGGPSSPANTFVTAYAVLGLKAAKSAGLETPAEAFAAASKFLQHVTGPDGQVGLYRPGDGVSITLGDPAKAPAAPLFTAASVIARIFCSELPSTRGLRAGAQQLTRLRPGFEPAYAYFGTYAQFQMGGEQWAAWTRAMKTALLSIQVVEPDQAGSWDPAGIWGALGGRAATTAVNALTLEIHYRYERAKQR